MQQRRLCQVRMSAGQQTRRCAASVPLEAADADLLAQRSGALAHHLAHSLRHKMTMLLMVFNLLPHQVHHVDSPHCAECQSLLWRTLAVSRMKGCSSSAPRAMVFWTRPSTILPLHSQQDSNQWRGRQGHRHATTPRQRPHGQAKCLHDLHRRS